MLGHQGLGQVERLDQAAHVDSLDGGVVVSLIGRLVGSLIGGPEQVEDAPSGRVGQQREPVHADSW